MKRSLCLFIVLLLLMGCGQKTISPAAASAENTACPTATEAPTPESSAAPVTPVPVATPAPTATPAPAVPTAALPETTEVLFPEELLSQEGEPLRSEVRSLMAAYGLTKEAFADRFNAIVQEIEALSLDLLRLSETGRTLTADRKEKLAASLTELMSDETLTALQTAYAGCTGADRELPVSAYTAALEALLQDVFWTADRTGPYFDLGIGATRDYVTVLNRYIGEPVSLDDLFEAMEALAQTEAFALYTALQGDPEAGRKKDPISLGDYAQNMAFLLQVTQALCPLPDGAVLPLPTASDAEKGMDLLELAFRFYPGLAFLQAYAEHDAPEQQTHWDNASPAYRMGLAVHSSHAVLPYLERFGLDYVQYRWYEEMLSVTLTGISALQIHYHGYAKTDLAAYLKGWGVESFAGYLYEKALSDPFDSLAAAYGYARYLDICQAALDAGCESEERFLQDYLAAGPRPFGELKEYMVDLYQKRG